jgi:hypothetical protein
LYWIDISADGQQLYVAGVTTSTTGIALNAHQDTYHGGQGDGFLCAFNAADGTLNWGTYYGGNEFDRLNGGMVEETGTLYLSGSTSSTSDIATEGTHQAEFAGNRDGFIVAFTPVGERLWGTYSGGNDFDGLGSLSVNNGALTVIGGTRSLTGIATADAMYPENTVNLDAFPPRSGSYLTQFNAIDGTLRWGTYLMPECYRLGISKIMTASDNKLIIGGLVSLASILCPDIITPGAHQSFAEGSGEAVLMFIQDNTLSVNSEDHHTLSIYPNPASHKVIIDLPDANFSRMHLQVIDLSGRVVLDVPAFAMGSAIELDGMAPGLYLVKGAQDGHYFSEKLVVGR